MSENDLQMQSDCKSDKPRIGIKSVLRLMVALSERDSEVRNHAAQLAVDAAIATGEPQTITFIGACPETVRRLKIEVPSDTTWTCVEMRGEKTGILVQVRDYSPVLIVVEHDKSLPFNAVASEVLDVFHEV